jgi:hypothetical protein
MNDANNEHRLVDDELTRLWRQDPSMAAGAERAARDVMARAWRFDQQILWRNFREYAVGLVLMVVFAGQIALDNDRIGGVIGLVCVGFVITYLWWRHRRLEPLDPAADLAEYRRALLQRFDDQIRLLRSVPYWYLLPLFLPGLWVAVSQFHRAGWAVLAPLGVLVAIYVFLGWLNVKVAVGTVRAARDEISAMGAGQLPPENADSRSAIRSSGSSRPT